MRAIYGVLGAVVVFGIVCGSAQSAEPAKIKWHHDLPSAIADAEKSQKPLLVKFTAPWCGFCKKMVRSTFSDAEIAEHVQCCYVAVSINTDDYPELIETFGVKVWPTTMLLNSDLQVQKRANGYKNATDFAKFLGPKCVCGTTDSNLANQVAGVAKVMLAPTPAPVKPIAFNGICLVSIVKDRKLVNGSPQVTFEYQGSILHFATKEHRDQFVRNPDGFWPQHNGICPVTYRQLNRVAVGKPALAIQYKGKIYLCADREAARTFLGKPQKFAQVAVSTRDTQRVLRTATAPANTLR